MLPSGSIEIRDFETGYLCTPLRSEGIDAFASVVGLHCPSRACPKMQHAFHARNALSIWTCSRGRAAPFDAVFQLHAIAQTPPVMWHSGDQDSADSVLCLNQIHSQRVAWELQTLVFFEGQHRRADAADVVIAFATTFFPIVLTTVLNAAPDSPLFALEDVLSVSQTSQAVAETMGLRPLCVFNSDGEALHGAMVADVVRNLTRSLR